MDIRQLRYFAAIAEEGQITKAAKKLHMAQPPLSQQLKALEVELGTLLIERNGKSMQLTEAGKLLYERATDLIIQLDETVMEVKEVGEGLKGILSIGSVKTCFSYLPERIRMFRELHPNVTFRLFEGDSFRLSQDLKNRDIELALIRLPLELDGLSSLPLPVDQFVAVIPEMWYTEESITLDEFAKMPLMLLHRIKGVGLYELVIEEFKKHQLEPKIICQCPDAGMLISLVRAGVGASFLPKSTLQSFPMKGLRIVEVNDFKVQAESALVWLTDRYLSKSTVNFIEMFKKEYATSLSHVE